MHKTIRIWTIVTLVGFVWLPVAHAQIENPSFETGDLTGWLGGGQFGVQDEVSYWGSHAAYVGTVDFDGDDFNDVTGERGGGSVSDNVLGQFLVPIPPGTTTLELAYNVFTWDCQTWDDPAFRVDASQGGDRVDGLGGRHRPNLPSPRGGQHGLADAIAPDRRSLALQHQVRSRERARRWGRAFSILGLCRRDPFPGPRAGLPAGGELVSAPPHMARKTAPA